MSCDHARRMILRVSAFSSLIRPGLSVSISSPRAGRRGAIRIHARDVPPKVRRGVAEGLCRRLQAGARRRHPKVSGPVLLGLMAQPAAQAVLTGRMGIRRSGLAQRLQPAGPPEQLMRNRVLREPQISLLAHARRPWGQLPGLEAPGKFLRRTPLICRWHVTYQEPPSICRVDLEGCPVYLGRPPPCRAGLGTRGRHGEQQCTLAVPQ